MADGSVSDRRSGASRRAANDDTAGNRREISDRHQADRRGYHLNLADADEAFVTRICQWLDENADGEWSVGTPDGASGNGNANCRVRLERQSDLAAFSLWVADWEKTGIG